MDSGEWVGLLVLLFLISGAAIVAGEVLTDIADAVWAVLCRIGRLVAYILRVLLRP